MLFEPGGLWKMESVPPRGSGWVRSVRLQSCQHSQLNNAAHPPATARWY